MDYKEKVIALLNSQELSKEQKEKLENIFPELKESEEERIVRCLLNYFNHVRYNGLDLKGTDVDEVIAWLEKQREKVTNINGEDYGIDGLYHAIKILERTVGRVTGYQSDDGILEHKAAINAVKELYEKQYAQKHYSDFNANDWYVSKVDGKIHNMTYNPNKVESKFKVRDWIVRGDTIAQILDVQKQYYVGLDINGKDFTLSKFLNDDKIHLWTIADAKNGDVLVASDDSIFLFAGIDDCACKYYAALTTDNYIKINKEEKGGYWETSRAVYPATKEQRDTLFAKMADAGYKWDLEKKELKKIETKTLYADKVIAWLVANICDFEYYVKLFKKDFGL